MANTASWMGVLRLIRTRLLTFTSASGGTTLATRLGNTVTGSGSDGKLFFNQAPDDQTGFWAVLRIIDAPQQGTDGGFMIRGIAELILYARLRSQQATVEAMADLVTEAWHGYTHSETGGHVSATDVSNRFLIPYVEPADRELVAVRLLLNFRCTPVFLTKYAA